MTVEVDLPVPGRVLAIGAHPDDVEFGAAGTLAKWAAAGASVHLCVCTDGSKGTWDGDADLDALAARRTQEQRVAAAELGATGVDFLGFVDGELVADVDARAAVCAVIRRVRPDVVLGHDPWRAGRLHPDHHAAGRLVVEGVVAARDPHFHPEIGPRPHRPATLLLFDTDHVDHVERVDAAALDRKVAALLAHRSQWRSTMGIHERPDEERAAFAARLRERARAEGLRAGVRAAEVFRRIDRL
jgi:LmbE family N-acetylglucosaminyl deacetylase